MTIQTYLPDGLYQVTYKNICAGFEVKERLVVRIPPILVRKFRQWEAIAVRVGE